MLTLGRRYGEKLALLVDGHEIQIVVNSLSDDQVSVSIDADLDVKVMREELVDSE